MATKKRKPNAYNRFVAHKIKKEGMTFGQAVAAYRKRPAGAKWAGPAKKRRTKKNPSTGVRGSYQRGGLDISGEYTMADALAGLAFIGGLGAIVIPGLGTVPGIILLTGSGAYFGQKYMFPQHEAQKKLLTAANNPIGMITRQPVQSAVIGGAALSVGWVAWRMNERRKLTKLLAEDHGIRAIRATFKGRLPPSEIAWTVEKGGLAKRAAEVLPIFGEGAMRNSLQGYDQIMAEMPAVKLVGKAGDIAEGVAEGVKDIFASFKQ